MKTINEIAQEHDMHPQLVTKWEKEILENASATVRGQAQPKPVDESSPEGKLYSEIGPAEDGDGLAQKNGAVSRQERMNWVEPEHADLPLTR